MTELTFKLDTSELLRQLNELDLSKYTEPKDLEEFVKENLEVVEVDNPEDISLYFRLKKIN